MKIESIKQSTLNFIVGDYKKFQSLPTLKKAIIIGLKVIGSATFAVGIGLSLGAPTYLVLKGIELASNHTVVAAKIVEFWAIGAVAWFQMTVELAGAGGDIGGFVFLALGGTGVLLFGAPLIISVIPGGFVSTVGAGLVSMSYELVDHWSDSQASSSTDSTMITNF